MSRTIVIAADGTEFSRGAFDWYIQFIHKSDDKVIICHIPEVPRLPTVSLKHGLQLPVEEWQKAITEQLEKVNKLEEEYEHELISRKINFKIRGEQQKKPGEGIIHVAEVENADMIVMGTRGLDTLRRTILGSVSDYVIRHAGIPVLVCPPKTTSSLG